MSLGSNFDIGDRVVVCSAEYLVERYGRLIGVVVGYQDREDEPVPKEQAHWTRVKFPGHKENGFVNQVLRLSPVDELIHDYRTEVQEG